MLLVELKRHRAYFKKHYTDFVRRGLITPYDRDQRKAVNEKLIQLVETAIKNKTQRHGPKLMELLNQMPND